MSDSHTTDPLREASALTSPSVDIPKEKHDSYMALRSGNFRILLASSFVSAFARQMISIAIGWELFERTNSALVLGGVGLAQIIPLILLFLPSGYIVDRYNRKWIFFFALILVGLASLAIGALSASHGSLWLIYGCLALVGGAQSFSQPASSVLIAQVVSERAFENAITWRTSCNHLASVLGPATGGFLIGIYGGATLVYVISAIALILVSVGVLFMQVSPQAGLLKSSPRSLGTMLEGLRFLWRTKVLLAAITLDLFAVLFGGATALLPIFAKDILHVGPIGLGWLQAADSLGAITMALFLAHRPPFRHAGLTLLLAVAGFGLATIILGFSQLFWLSLLILFILGALDNISMVIRGTLILVRTPNEMRGRVSSVTSLFIGTSNQLGGFESGLAAQFLGPVLAVALGGVGTILVVVIIALTWPQIRHLRTLREDPQE